MSCPPRGHTWVMAARKRWNIQEVEVNEGMRGGGAVRTRKVKGDWLLSRPQDTFRNGGEDQAFTLGTRAQ